MPSKIVKQLDPDALQRQLERDIDVIRRYREVQARYGGEVPDGATPADKSAPQRDAKSLVGVVEASLTDAWQRTSWYTEKASAVRGSAKGASVRNTLKRLVHEGVAEKRGNKAAGNVEYRRKTA